MQGSNSAWAGELADPEDWPATDDGATVGTICEYTRDDWTWVAITDVLDDGENVKFVNLDELGDDWTQRFEDADDLRDHAHLARTAAIREGAHYHAPADIFKPLGPLHPEHRGDGDGD